MRQFAIAIVGVTLVLGSVGAQQPVVQVYKSPACGCCVKWVEHLNLHGFATQVSDVVDVEGIKTQHGVPAGARSCHTAIVQGYAIEGHVPAAEIQRLLRERPAIAGLAVPGMPIGSPGMEGAFVEPYDVLAFRKDGSTGVFATYPR